MTHALLRSGPKTWRALCGALVRKSTSLSTKPTCASCRFLSNLGASGAHAPDCPGRPGYRGICNCLMGRP